MPIHDLGYRGWKEQLASPWTRWVVIARAGIRRAWQSTWLKRMMFFAWLPAIGFGAGFFISEHSLMDHEFRRGLRYFLFGDEQVLGELINQMNLDDEVTARHSVWSFLLYSFLRYPQGAIMALMVGIIAPPLISQDVRSRAFLLYFSRPIARWQYALGKLATVWFYLLMISAVPALVLYILGILLSPSASVVFDTWDLPLRIIVASAVLMVPTASLALCMSSLTQESRYAAFAWFAALILGAFTYFVMTIIEINNTTQSQVHLVTEKWAPASLYHALGQVQAWVFGISNFDQVKYPAATLVGITVLSTIVLFRRISAPLRA
jgi:ABC-type transport system involved in multi-copper enzyme maturation permease subunit